MAEFQTAPAGAGTGQKLLTWIDNRFPMSKLYKDKPAPDNLRVPPHMYLADNRLVIGEEKKA